MLVWALVPFLDRIRERFRFDVIDAEFFFPDGPAAVALGRRYGVPVSIKARGADIHFWGRQPATARQVRDAGQKAAGLLAVSQALRDDIAALGIDRGKVTVHHTGVDLDRFAPADRAAAKRALGVDGPLVASVGALIPRKGHAIVIDAVARLPGVHLRIAGDGPDRAQLQERIRALGVADRVALMGGVPHDALPALLAAADVSALASASEGLANAWIESLACGTPVVITGAGGAAEVVDRPAAGRIVERDVPAFARGIAELLGEGYPSATVRAVAERFTWAANTAALHDYLSALVARQSRG